LLLAALFGGGWFLVGGPGAAPFQELLKRAGAKAGQSQNGAAQPPDWGTTIAGPPRATLNPSSVTPAAPPTPLFGGPAIRIASFNIQVFGDAKAKKPHVMWTLAAIIRNFHIVAIQEIRTQDDYFIDNFLREHVNRDGRVYNRVVGPRLGRSSSKEQYAFLYDTAAVELNSRSVYTLNDPDDLLHREPLVAMFRSRAPPEQAFTFVLVNMHTDPDETDTELDALEKVYQVVRQSAGEDDVILLGDLNVDDRRLGRLGQIPGVRPVVRGVFTNTRQDALYDNIILHQQSTAEFTGRWGVYDIEQMHTLTREQALQVSDHLPVWAEFSAYEAYGPGRVAGRPGEAWPR
jgi:endonuclease/exonuclease/phosphatase family metal-dependent hydrolase